MYSVVKLMNVGHQKPTFKDWNYSWNIIRLFHNPCTTVHIFLCLTHSGLDEMLHWLCRTFPCN